MINNNISVNTRIYRPEEVCDFELKTILQAIRTGNFMGQDLIGITRRIQAEPEHERQNELKYWNLPVALFNGTFSYKNDCGLKGYSSFTAIDLDNFSSVQEMENARMWLMQREYVYSVFTTPSGHGLKAIVIHDSNSSQYHEELYAQLLALFNLQQKDASVCDLSRGNYICYDPNLYVNPNCVPYHFVHNPLFMPKPRAYSGLSRAGSKNDIRMLKWALSLKKPIGIKSDESIIAILNSHWKKQPYRWAVGNRAKSVFKSATELCWAGVKLDKALNYLVGAYNSAGLGEDEIMYQAIRGYQLNAASYGTNRSKFDSYGGKRHQQKKS